jgi:hypothetical protein
VEGNPDGAGSINGVNGSVTASSAGEGTTIVVVEVPPGSDPGQVPSRWRNRGGILLLNVPPPEAPVVPMSPPPVPEEESEVLNVVACAASFSTESCAAEIPHAPSQRIDVAPPSRCHEQPYLAAQRPDRRTGWNLSAAAMMIAGLWNPIPLLASHWLKPLQRPWQDLRSLFKSGGKRE